MLQSYKLSNKFKDFLEKGLFIDCILHCGEKSVKCHRIVLSRFSNQFREIFTENVQDGSIKDVDIAQEFENNLENIIYFFYGYKLEITEDNIIAILAFGIRYKCNVLREAAHDNLVSYYANKETVMNISRQMLAFGIADNAEQIIPIFVENFDFYSINELIRSVSAKELGMIISNEKFKTKAADDDHLTEFRLSILDRFCELTPVTDENVKEFLEGIFDWTKDDSYLFVVKHKCKWARDSTVLPLYMKAMRLRRQAYKEFKKETENIKSQKISRWIPLQWCSETLNTVSSFDSFDVIDFCMTLGGAIKDFNPLTLGVLSSKFSTPLGLSDGDPAVKNYTAIFGPHEAFMHNDRYFTSVNAGSSISVSFGDESSLRMKKIIVSSVPDNAGITKLNKKPSNVSTKKEIRLGYPTSLKLTTEKGILCNEVKFEDQAVYEADDVNAKEIKISMANKNRAGGNVLRIGSIKIYGRFVSE